MSRHTLKEARRKREWKASNPDSVREQNKRAYLKRRVLKNIDARTENVPARNEKARTESAARTEILQARTEARTENLGYTPARTEYIPAPMDFESRVNRTIEHFGRGYTTEHMQGKIPDDIIAEAIRRMKK